MAQQQQQQLVLMQCAQQQLAIEKSLHQLACQETILIKEKHEHDQQYDSKDVQELMRNVQRELSLAKIEAEQLKLDGLRQRKQNSILRLKLASAKEDVDLLQRNMALLEQHSQRMAREVAGLQASLATATQQLTDVSAAKAVLHTEADKYKSEALQAGMEVTRLREDLKLATGRLNTATGQAADLLQQFKSVQAENTSLTAQLALSQGRDTEAAAAHTALQETLDGMKADLNSLRQRLAAEEQARVAAEAAAAKSAAAAEAAADALAVKEQQMAGWRDLEQASKATATQQMQLSQAQLDSMYQRATATEAKLLDQITSLQEQLDKERSARFAAEATSTVAASKATADHAAMERELAALRGQVKQAQADLSAAQATAANEAKHAAALRQEVELLQEQVTRAAVETVGELVEGLTQGQETEDEAEQPQQLQRQPAGAAAAAKQAAAAAAAKRKQCKAVRGAVAAVAATPVVRTAVFAAGPAAELSGIEEGTEGEDGDVMQQPASVHEQVLLQQEPAAPSQPEQQAVVQQTTTAGGRRPRNAKSKAQQQIKAAAAAVDALTPSSPATADGGDSEDDKSKAARRVSPRTKAASTAAKGRQQHSQGGTAAASDHIGRPVLEGAADGAAPEAAPARGPPPLSFVPQSMATPAAALQQSGVMKAAAQRLSAASMLKKLNQGGVSHTGKPGGRKRKIGPIAGNGSMDVVPSSLIMSSGFKPPKVRHLG